MSTWMEGDTMDLRRIFVASLSGLLLVPALSLPTVAVEVPADPAQTVAEKAQHAVELSAQYSGADSVQYALWEDGEITLSGHAGVYSRTENRALTGEELYGIGSISKTYTAAAVLKLSEAGKLSLDKPVTTYLPGFKMADERYRDITVRMLLDHSSGLMGDNTRNAFLFDDTDTTAADTLLERLSTQRLKAAPGAYSVYCNDGFTLAELVVEAVSGMDYMDFVRSALLTPAGLQNTYAPGDDFDTARLAKTYVGPQDSRALPLDTVGIVGTGGLYTTATDLARFGGALCGTDLLTQASLDTMSTDWASKGLWPADSADDQLGYGLGWDNVHMFPFNQSGVTALTKGGDTLRYHAALIVLPEHNKALAVLSSGGSSIYNGQAGARILIDALAEDGVTVGETASLPVAQPAPMPETEKDYAGTYASLGTLATISFQGNTLTLAPNVLLNAPPQTYVYYSDGSFRDAENTVLIKFVTGENGRTYLYQKGYTSIPGLTVLGTANYAMERLEPNTQATEEALSAWAERGEKLYLILNEKYTSQVYLSGPFVAVGVLPEAPGYVALDRIVDETHAEQYLALPGTGSRNGMDLTARTVDGEELLLAGDYLCQDSSTVPALYAGEGAYSTIQADGRARWFQVGDLAGKTLRVTVPGEGGFTVYSQNGQVSASSVAYGDTSATLPENGWVVFAGTPGARFHLSTIE